MTDTRYRILILDDDAALGEMLSEFLTNTGQCSVIVLNTEVDFWEQIQRDSAFDILFLDYRLSSQTTGLDVLTRMGQAGITIPTVMMTGEGSEMIAAKAIQSGAMDYLVKADYNFSGLLPLVEKAVRMRQMQQAMQRYLDQIRYQSLLLDAMRDAVVVWDTTGTITYWNNAAEALYGAPAAERLGQPVASFFFPYFTPNILAQQVEQAGNLQIEHRYCLPGGRQTWVSSHFTTLLGGSGEDIVGSMSVARDITPRKQEQEALIQSQNFVKRILDTSPNIITIFDLRNGQIRYTNPEIFDILGYTVEEFQRLSLRDFVQLSHPEDRPLLARHLHTSTTWSDGEVIEREARFQKKNGEWCWLRSRETVFSREPDGTPREIIGSMQDVTISKAAELALRDSEARYRTIVDDHQTEMICRFLADGTLTFVNEAYARYYNRSREALLGTNFLAAVQVKDRAAAQAALAAVHLSQPVAKFEHPVQLADGKARWQEWVARAIFEMPEHPLEFQAVGRDITERKQMEAQIDAAQTSLAQAARLASIGELASGVAHQISNPLTTIIADAQILAHQLDHAHPARESADAIMEAGWRAQQVINELMKFSQPSRGTYESVSINSTINTALLLASAHIHASGIELRIELEEDLPQIQANPRQLTDLWVNLLLLARGALSRGQTHQIRISSRKEGENAILVEVADNGSPIPAEQYHTIFEPRLIAPGEGRGSGIELSLCREIVRQHHGQISVSRQDQETVFTIIFAVEGTLA